MNFLHDPFWQFVISTTIAVAGIIIPLLISFAQSRKPQQMASPQWSQPVQPSSNSTGCWIIPVISVSLFLIVVIIFFNAVSSFISGALSHLPFETNSIASLTSSTPDQTLDTFCHSIQSGAYQQAYDEYSTQLKARVSSSQFVDSWSDQNLEACTHDTITVSGSQASTTLTTRNFFTHNIKSYKVTLVQEGNQGWRIENIEAQA